MSLHSRSIKRSDKPNILFRYCKNESIYGMTYFIYATLMVNRKMCGYSDQLLELKQELF